MTNLAFLVMLSCAAASDALVTPPAALYVTASQPLGPYQAPLPDKQCASSAVMGQIEFKMIYLVAPSPKHAVVVFDAAVDDTNDGDDTNDTNDTGALALPDTMFDSRLHLWAWYVRRRFVQTTKQKTEQKIGLTPPSSSRMFVTGILRVRDAAVHCMGFLLSKFMSCVLVSLFIIFHALVLVPLSIVFDALKFFACLLVVAGAVLVAGVIKTAITAADIRQRLVDWLRANRHIEVIGNGLRFTVEEHIAYFCSMSFDAYVNAMVNPTEMGDHGMILAASHLFGVNIFVGSAVGNAYDAYYPTPADGALVAPPEVTLLHDPAGVGHYDAVVPAPNPLGAGPSVPLLGYDTVIDALMGNGEIEDAAPAADPTATPDPAANDDMSDMGDDGDANLQELVNSIGPEGMASLMADDEDGLASSPALTD